MIGLPAVSEGEREYLTLVETERLEHELLKVDVKTKLGASVGLYHGDCLDLISKIDKKIDLTFLDPPFNQGKEYENHNDSMPDDTYWKMIKNVCQDVYDKTSLGGAIYFMQREKNAMRVLSILDSTGWSFQNMIIWRKKTSAVPMRYRYGKQYQVIIFATKSKRPRKFNKLRIDPELPPSYKFKRESGIFVTDVWDDIRELTSGYFAGDEPLTNNEGRFHKQQTSLAVLLRIVLSSSVGGDCVLDPFAGTGTTSLVCSQLNRHSISIEKSNRNIICIRKRIENIRDVDNVNRFFDSYKHTKNLESIWNNNTVKTINF